MGLKNIPLSTFREYLKYKGLNHIGTNGGHEKWSKQGMLRPVTIQTHIDPVPEFIVQNCLRNIGVKRKDLEDWLNPKKSK